MDKNLLDALYMSYNEKIGVMSDNGSRTISRVLGTDLTLVLDKKAETTYLLVPLTRNHTFECNGDSIIVDGKEFGSDFYFRKDACQWIKIQSNDMLSLLA